MKVVMPKFDFVLSDPPPEKHIGWIWLVKMREDHETTYEEVEDAWIAENPREAIAKSQAMYPDAKLVSCHRREEITNHSMVRQMMDGRVMDF